MKMMTIKTKTEMTRGGGMNNNNRSSSSTKRLSVHHLLLFIAAFTAIGLFFLTLRSLDDDDPDIHLPTTIITTSQVSAAAAPSAAVKAGCATVEEMGRDFHAGYAEEESLRVRHIIHRHFDLHGASRVRDLPPEQFCRHGFVIAKASEAGFGNEMYKILTAAALSVMLNRSLIIGQTRHIEESIHLGIMSLIQISPSPWVKLSIYGDRIVV